MARVPVIQPVTPASSNAVFSPCRTYRYMLWRTWGEGGRTANFVMLNPSTATETLDDPTIRRCIGFARRWGCARLVVTNIFAYRSTDPRALYDCPVDPVGDDNERWIKHCAGLAHYSDGPVVAAWGTHGALLSQGDTVHGWLRCLPVPVECLRLTSSGQPGHPLYLRNNARLLPYGGPTR